jgi:hypothetical protein
MMSLFVASQSENHSLQRIQIMFEYKPIINLY